MYDNHSKIADSVNTKKVFINLGVEDLQAEYERMKELGIAMQLIPIRYINVFSPYWYFTFMDQMENHLKLPEDMQKNKIGRKQSL